LRALLANILPIEELPATPSHLSAELKIWGDELLAHRVWLSFHREGSGRRIITIHPVA
jgi:hypothetical protein